MRLRYVARLNPSVEGLGSRNAGDTVSFLPLEAIWSDDRFDPSQGVEFSGDVKSYNPVAEGDLVVPKVAPTFAHGRVAIASGLIGGRALATSEVFVVRPANASDARFLMYRFRSRDFIDEGVASWTGVAGLKRISATHVRNVSIDPGAWAFRRAIADFLDRECERIDTLIRGARSLATTSWESYWEIARSELLLRMEGGPTTRLKHLVEAPVGGTWGMGPGEDDIDVAVARVADFDRRALAVVYVPTMRSVTRAAARRLGLRVGDLLLEKSGGGERSPVGFVARYAGPDGAVSSNFIARLRPRIGTESAYLQHLFGALYAGRANVPYVRQVTGIQNLDVAGYLGLRVPDRDPHEQHSIAQRFVARLQLVNALEAQCDRLDARLVDYRDALITEAVTGRLDVPNLSDAQLDESARAAVEGEPPEVLAS